MKIGPTFLHYPKKNSSFQHQLHLIMAKIFIILTFWLGIFALAKNIHAADQVTFFEHIEFNGATLTQNLGPSCVNMPSDWNDRASSVNTQGHCVRVFDDINCQGAKTDISPGSKSHNNLVDLGWNDRISSSSSCTDGGSGGDGGWRQGALDAHNRFRDRHGVPALVLDDDVNNSAQRCADYLAANKIFDHICGQVFGHHYGENLAGGSGFNDGAQSAIDATNMWYSEEPKHDYDNNNFQYPSGHFSQVVWKNSQRLGLGYGVNGDFKIIVGHYDPPGNYEGEFLKNVFRPRN